MSCLGLKAFNGSPWPNNEVNSLQFPSDHEVATVPILEFISFFSTYWLNDLELLNLSFLLCKMGMIIFPCIITEEMK